MGMRSDIAWYREDGYGDPFAIKRVTEAPLIICAAITGVVPTKNDTPHVPLSAEEIINDAFDCYRAGARIVHLHARDKAGGPTCLTEQLEYVIPEIRKACQDIVLCVSTSGRRFAALKDRAAVLDLTGDAKPDMASLTLGSMNFAKEASMNSPQMIADLAALMAQKGIIPELEVFELGMVHYSNYMIKKKLLHEPLHYNLFLGSLGTMPAYCTYLEHMIEALPPKSSWAGAGIGKFQLPINIAAVMRGGHVRTGIEDNLYLDSAKKELATNEQLVRRLADFAHSIGREIATPEHTRRILGVKH